MYSLFICFLKQQVQNRVRMKAAAARMFFVRGVCFPLCGFDPSWIQAWDWVSQNSTTHPTRSYVDQRPNKGTEKHPIRRKVPIIWKELYIKQACRTPVIPAHDLLKLSPLTSTAELDPSSLYQVPGTHPLESPLTVPLSSDMSHLHSHTQPMARNHTNTLSTEAWQNRMAQQRHLLTSFVCSLMETRTSKRLLTIKSFVKLKEK